MCGKVLKKIGLADVIWFGERIGVRLCVLPSYPEIHLRGKFLFMRKKETISAGIFIKRDHLQTVDLAPIVLSSSLNSGIQTQGGLRCKAG